MQDSPSSSISLQGRWSAENIRIFLLFEVEGYGIPISGNLQAVSSFKLHPSEKI
jgi:hypothetical protein